MKKYIKKNKKVYDRLSQQYLQRLLKKSEYETNFLTLVSFFKEQYEILYKHLPTTVLELGPGAGGMLKAFDKIGCNTCAVEISTNMAEVAHRISPKSIIINKDILASDIFLKEQFDIIFAGAFLHLFTLEDEKRILGMIRQWLSNDGVFCMYTRLYPKTEEGIFEKKDYVGDTSHFQRRWMKEDLFDFLESNGFVIVASNEHYEKDRDKIWINLILKRI